MKKRNPEKTRKKILKAATETFAQKGFSGTSISALVKASGYNERMIYHYFGDKAGLYRAVFVQKWQELKEWFDAATKKRLESGVLPQDLVEVFEEAASIFFDYMAEHPGLIRLFLWEGLEDGHITRSLWQDLSGPIYAQAEFVLKEAQNEGRLDKKHDPAHLIVSAIGLVGYYFAFAHTLQDLFGENAMSKNALKKRKEQVLYLIRGFFQSGN